MQIIFTVFLVIHILGGSLALISGPVAMSTSKGGRAHRISGKAFFAGMSAVFISAMMMASIHFNPFLLMIGVFSYYLASSGYRALYRKRVRGPKDVKALDWIILGVAGIFHSGLLLYGILLIASGSSSLFAWLSVVFGAIAINSVRGELAWFIKPGKDKMAWLYAHISGMMGAYIAAVTAFSAVNLYFIPGMVRWLWPTIAGTPVIIIWIRYYKQKYRKPKGLQEI